MLDPPRHRQERKNNCYSRNESGHRIQKPLELRLCTDGTLAVGLVWKRKRSTSPCLAIEHRRFGRAWSVHTCRGNQYCEHVDVKLFLQARSEPPEPFVLSQVGQLLSCRRAFKL